jgi:drug/metabolite transporter (DMT)-like permease
MPVALKRIKATTAVMYVNVQPMVASTAAIIAGQDVFTWDKPVALLLVVAGVYMVTRSKTEKLEVSKKGG